MRKCRFGAFKSIVQFISWSGILTYARDSYYGLHLVCRWKLRAQERAAQLQPNGELKREPTHRSHSSMPMQIHLEGDQLDMPYMHSLLSVYSVDSFNQSVHHVT